MDSAYRSMDEDDRETSIHIHADASTPIMSSAPSSHPTSTSTSISSSQTILQSDAFTCRGDPANVTLNGNAVTIVTGGESIICPFADMIGCLLRAGRSISLHSYPYTPPSCFGKPIREHKPIHLRASDDATAQRWYDAITHVLHGGEDEKQPIQQRRILVILNPASGTGQAIRRFQEVEPMFKHSGAHYDVIHTTHAGHAFEITNTLDSTKYDSVVCVSGDGLLSEAVNGLMNRADWQTVVRQIRIGLVGAGSGNGLAKSIVHASNHEYSATNCAFIVLKGRARYLDLFTVIQPSARPFFGFLSVSWAIISDVDLESDDWRCCGPARFTVAAIARMISLRQYHGTLAFVKAEGIDTKPAKHPRGFPAYDVCTGPGTCSVCANSTGETQMNELQSYLTQVRPFIGTSDTWTKEDHKQDTPIQFPEVKGTEEKWEEITDDWVSLWGMNVTHAATDMHVAPIAHFSDGTMDLTFMRHGVGRCSLLSMFLDIETASHTNHPHLEYVKVKALRLTPLSQRHSPIDIDGEQIKYAPSEIRVFRGILQLLC